MQTEPRNIIQSLLGRENLIDVPRDEVRMLAEKHPYSPLVQYLLTRRLQLSGDPGYGESVARTAIYFHNPHWLSLLLRRQTADERMSELEQSLGLAHAEASAVAPEEAQLEEERLDESPVEMEEEAPYEILLPEAGEDTLQTEAFATELSPGDAAIPATWKEAEDEPASKGADHLQSAQEEQAPAMETTEAGETNETETLTGPEESDNDDDAAPSLRVSSPEEEVPSLSGALGETEEVMPIQPLHTLDYFASQGVKLETETTAPVATKVLSFPEWLRAMKPVHPSKPSDTDGRVTVEEAVRQDAEESDTVEEILTEAMAEVYAKQGLRLKAIDIYRKLSLLHPDKSSIFAAKIEQLKGIAS